MQDPVFDPVPVRPRRSVVAWLRLLSVGDTYRFPIGTSVNSVRSTAVRVGIKISAQTLDNGQVKVTRTE